MIVWLLCDWLTESEWNLKLLKVKWEGIKGLSQTFIFAFTIFVNSNSFQIQNPREEITWLLPFKMKRVFETIWIYLEIFSNSETLSNSMIFMREDKMTSPNHMKYELEV